MIPYQKINSIYKRDPSGKQLLMGQYSCPEFEFLENCDWVFTEKVDGTNIRVMHTAAGISFGGKSDNASIPVPLWNKLQELFPVEKFLDYYPENELPEERCAPASMCLYGEGYGPKIQSGGKYRSDISFVLFDVKVGDYWLSRASVEDVAKRLNIDVVPVICRGGLLGGTALVQQGFRSTWGDFTAEGLVGIPSVPLFNNKGERIVVKIKYKDFQ